MSVADQANCTAKRGRFGKAITKAEHPVKVKHYIISGKLTAICRRNILPVDSLAQMENKSALGL